MIRFGRMPVSFSAFARPDGNWVRRATVTIDALRGAPRPRDFRIFQVDVALAGIDLMYLSSDHHIRRIIAKVTSAVAELFEGQFTGSIIAQVEIQLADQDPRDDPYQGSIDIFWIAHTNEPPV